MRALNKQLAKGTAHFSFFPSPVQVVGLILALPGQELQVKFDNAPSGPKGGAKSLLARLDKESLANRISDPSPPSVPHGSAALSERFCYLYRTEIILIGPLELDLIEPVGEEVVEEAQEVKTGRSQRQKNR